MRLARMVRVLEACALVLVLGACATAQDRLDEGVELERAGQAVGASNRYIQALRKDPALAEARTRLVQVGPRALAFHLEQAERDRLRGDPVAAADSMLAADALLAGVRSVQVPVAVPPGFAQRRRSALDAAIAHLNRDAAAAWGQARWQEALALYDRIPRYDPSPARAAIVQDARMHTLVHWAQAELDAGHYRSAVDIAEQALAEGGAATGYADAFESIRDDALNAGTLRVVFLSLAAPSSARATTDFAARVDALLHRDHWGRPLPFIEPIHGPGVRRRTRHRGRDAVAAARRFRADLAVAPTLESYRVEERDVREGTRKASTGRGRKVSYKVRSGTRQHRATVRYRIVSASGETIRTRSVSATHGERFEEARYRGNADELRLSVSERRAFDRHEGGRPAAKRLADRLARQVRKDLEGEIP